MNEFPVLPDVHFLDTDAQEVIDRILGGYEALAGVVLAQGDPRRLFLLSLAYIIINQRQQIDAAGKSNLLRYAQGDFLDHLGAFRMTPRHKAVGAITTMRFTLSQVRPAAIGIPYGTRVTADGEIFWSTTAAASIPPGQLFADVVVQCAQAGGELNGLPPGSITDLVDPIPFVASVANIDTTQGGQDREEDDPYRERIYQAPAAFSTAGPREAYEYWAYTASPAISHVVATSPSPGVAEVRVLLQGGEIPDQAILDAVDAALSPETVRPLTDSVEVKAPDAVPYSIDVTYYVRRMDQGSLVQIQERVADAVAAYVAWQRERIGRDINPDVLIAQIREAGAKRAEIASPSFTVVEPYQVAQEQDVQITFGGVEDE